MRRYTRNTKKRKKLDKRNVREVPKQIFVNMPLGLIKCNINFFKKLLTVFLITRHFRQHIKNRVTRKIQLLKNLNTDCIWICIKFNLPRPQIKLSHADCRWYWMPLLAWSSESASTSTSDRCYETLSTGCQWPRECSSRLLLWHFDCVRGAGPDYFKQVICPVSEVSCRSHRSASRGDLFVSRANTSIGQRRFSIAAPVVWNTLTPDLRSPHISRQQFRSKLKTHLFRHDSSENNLLKTETL